ncbi:MAG: hypothetical protein FJZ58_08575, partial [Chlamydiae bacterium]|nr:hypothetical protein [Chlamydiota bacterium]
MQPVTELCFTTILKRQGSKTYYREGWTKHPFPSKSSSTHCPKNIKMFEEQAITDKGKIMILHPVIENLQKLRLKGFVEALKIQMASSEASNLRFEERLSLLIEHEMNSRENRKLQNRL